MRKRSTVVLAGLTATIVLGALAGGASARRLAFSNQSFRITWAAFELLGMFGPELRCPVTIEGSFHSRTLSKALEQLVGYVTRAISNEQRCTGGSARMLTTNLPWHIRYNGFSGTLPDITQIHVRAILVEWLLQTTGVVILRCLYRSTVAKPWRAWLGREASGAITALTPDSTQATPLAMRLETSMECPTEIFSLERPGTVTVAGTTTKITVTLVA